MEIEDRYRDILIRQAKAKTNEELLNTIIQKDEYDDRFVVFTKEELLKRLGN